MRRAIGVVLLLLASAAGGQTTSEFGFIHVGSYTPAGLTVPVDVYDLRVTVTGGVIGSIVLNIGADYMGYGGNPFQVGIQSRQYEATPTVYDANTWLATETYAWQSDSHFLIPPDWAPAVVLPTEKNDRGMGTYVDPYGQTEVRGLGGLTVAVAVPVANRVSQMDVVRVGVPRYSAVYVNAPHGGLVHFPMPCRNAWQGSGTGGSTATDPNDPTVQWSQLDNWSRGVVPDLGDDVRIDLANPGRAVAASGSVGSLWVDGASAGGTFEIPGAADLGITGSLIVGAGGTGAATQSGSTHCTIFALGEETSSYGAYSLSDGQLNVDVRSYVGYDGKAVFTQTGGVFDAGAKLTLGCSLGAEGTYRLQGGQAAAGSVHVNYGHSLFHQTGGSLNAERVSIWKTSTYRLEQGDVQVSTESVRGTFLQNGGRNTVAERLTVGEYYTDSPLYELRGGTLRADEIVGPTALLGGVLSVQRMEGTLVNDGAVIAPGQPIGMMNLGGLVQNSGTLSIELARLSNFDKVWIAKSATLGGVLELRSLSNYRPREGESFPIITVTSSHPGTPYFQGDFAAITSNITTGLGGGAAFGGEAAGQEYRVTFLGWTGGDANGDHVVDGGDLALVGGTWMQAGKGWSEGDFTGDGLADGGDLALFGGNWMWALPPAAPPGVPLPEPAAGCLLGLGGMALLGRQRRARGGRVVAV